MSRTSVHKTLQTLPRTLDSTYERIILDIDEEYRHHAIIALHWLSCTRRPLKLLELAEAVAVQDSVDEAVSCFHSDSRLFRPSLILEICSSLVSSSGMEASSDVRLAHFTVQEYLLSERIYTSPAAAFSVTLAKGNAIMATFCVSYMLATAKSSDDQATIASGKHAERVSELFGDETVDTDSLSDDPLLRYSTKFWYQHANSITQHPPELSAMILQLLSHNPDQFSVTDGWCYAAKYSLGIWYHASHDSHLEDLGGSVGIASYLGLLPEVKVLLELDLGASCVARSLDTAFQAAVYGGHIDVLEMALSKGANVNSRGGVLECSLHAAAFHGHTAVVNALLENGADANLQGGKCGTALQAAAQGGHKHVCELLLGKGSSPNAGIGLGAFGSPLQAAAYRMDLDMVERLLDRGADPNAPGGKYGSALQAASYRSCKAIVDLLIERGADPSLEGGEDGTALQAATHWRNTDIVQCLLETGANPDANTGKYQYGSSLQAAANWGHQDIVDLLFAKGADPNSQEGMYGTALDAAITRKDRDMCQCVLENGARIIVEDGEYEALINAAIADGRHAEAVNLLLETSLDSNAEIGYYGKAIQLASLKGYKDALRLTKQPERGVLPHGLSPRHYLTRMLRDNLTKIIPEPEPGSTREYSAPFITLHWAAWHNHVEIVDAITKKGLTDPESDPKSSQTFSIRAAPSGGSLVTQRHTHRYRSSSRDNSTSTTLTDWSPLHLSIYRNHPQVAEALGRLQYEEVQSPDLRKSIEF